MFERRVSCTLSCADVPEVVVLRKGLITAVALVTAGLVAGCGGGSSKPDPAPAAGSSSARQLLSQTFDGDHTIKSGVITLDVKVVPSGSTTVTQPLELRLSGPFTSSGAGKLPESDFTIMASAQGQQGSLQVISAGGKGYITVSGQSYEMPASSLKSLESGVGSLATGGSSSSGSGPFAKLGIEPLDWLTDPQVVGGATVGGVATTQVHASVDTAAMLHDVSKLLGRTSSLGVSGAGSLPQSISAATQKRIASALGAPSFDVWTGKRDKIVRKLTVSATIPVTGQVQTLLGGLTSAAVTLDFEYSDLNQPQTITAPTSVKPYSVFQSKVDSILQEIESGLVSGSLTTTINSGSAGATTGSSADQKYTNCITGANGDVRKMQKCSKLLGTG
jgi:hypothetical protein